MIRTFAANHLLVIALAFGAPAALGGCAHPAVAPRPVLPPAAADPVEVDLAPGERAALPGGAALRYIALVSDSRCPPDAHCIQAGEAVLGFQLVTPSGARSFELKTVAPHDVAVVDGRRIQLLDVARGPHTRARVAIDRPN